MEESQKAFEDASKTLKTEVTRFEVSQLLTTPALTNPPPPLCISPQTDRAVEFKTKIISYLESIMHMQQEVCSVYTNYNTA